MAATRCSGTTTAAADSGGENKNVSPAPAQKAQARRIARDLAALGFALPGTLADRMTRCSHPGCRCHADPPRPHGPYHQWTRKNNGKTATRILTDDQLADHSPWFDNHRRLRELITELEEPASPPPRPTPAGTASQAAGGGAELAGQGGHRAPGKLASQFANKVRPWVA